MLLPNARRNGGTIVGYSFNADNRIADFLPNTYITLTKNGKGYKIIDEQENDINFEILVKLSNIKDINKYSYSLYKGEDFNMIDIFSDNNMWYSFIIPKDFIVNEDNIARLYEFAKNNK